MLLQAASTRCPLPSHAVHPFRKSASTAVSVPSQYALLILVCRQANVHSAIVLQLVQHITVEELASRGGDAHLLASLQERSGQGASPPTVLTCTPTALASAPHCLL